MNPQIYDDMFQYLNFPPAEHDEKHMQQPEVDFHLPMYTDAQWAELLSCPLLEGYAAGTSYLPAASNALQLRGLETGATTSYASPASSSDSSDALSYSPISDFLSTYSHSRGITPNGDLRDSLFGPKLGITKTSRHNPYAERKRNPASTSVSLQSWIRGPAPKNAVFEHSSPEEIRAEMCRLSQLLRGAGISSSKYHPCMKCPVYDCPQGGYNPLLHETCFGSSQAQAPVGTFFTTNEISRHVRSVHTPDMKLRCHDPGCDYQTRLDVRAGGYGKGRFSRVDVLRLHLKNNPSHRASIPEELRLKYRLWKQVTAAEFDGQ